MSLLLRSFNVAIRRFLELCKLVLLACALVLAAMIAVGIFDEHYGYKPVGSTVIAPVLRYTEASTWPEAFAFIAFTLGGGALAAVILLMASRAILRRILLLRSDPATGEVMRLRQTGASVNQSPVMAIWLKVNHAGHPMVVKAIKLIDLGNMPRPGDRVRVAVSRIDPTCVAYLGPAR